jgi:hypothetical protein
VTPTLNYSYYQDKWSVYTDPQLGFSFEYPAIFDVEPYRSCLPSTDVREPDRLAVTTRIFVKFASAEGTSASEYIDSWLGQDESVTGLTKRDAYINRVRVLVVHYQFGLLGRYGEHNIFDNGAFLFDVGYFAGGDACAVPELGLGDSYDIYTHVVATFRLDD